MPTVRQKRVADQLREVIGELLLFEVQDPKLQNVTVMEVTIDRELEVATVYVHAMTGEDAEAYVLKGLEHAKGFLRRELGRRIRLQKTPELRFKWDESLETGDKIDKLLAGLDIPPSEDEIIEADE
jgi:ribosome-binding factor A